MQMHPDLIEQTTSYETIDEISIIPFFVCFELARKQQIESFEVNKIEPERVALINAGLNKQGRPASGPRNKIYHSNRLPGG